MPSIFDNNPALKNRNGATNISLAAAMKAAPNASTDSVIKIPLSRLLDYSDNEDVFGYRESEIESLEHEIGEGAKNFHGSLEVVESEDNPGYYTIISGHQRKRALERLGVTEAPCQVLKGMSEQQARDYWMSSNVLRRKITTLQYIKLIRLIDADYEASKKRKDGSKFPGGKTKLCAEKLSISEANVKRFRALSLYPDSILAHCDVTGFPYPTLMSASDFTADEFKKLDLSLTKYESKHADDVIQARDLKKIIDKIKDDRSNPEYGDADPLENYENHTGEGGREAKEFEKKQIEEIDAHYAAIEEKSNSRKPQIIDEKLVAGVDSLFDLVSGPYTVGNRMLANQAIIGLKKILRTLESQKY